MRDQAQAGQVPQVRNAQPVCDSWHNLSVEGAAAVQGTDLGRGLTDVEAASRLRQFGPNELVEREGPSFRQLLLDQFRQFPVPGSGQDLVRAQTMAFVTLSVSQLLRAYTARSEHYGVHQIGPFTNRAMQWAVIVSLAIILAVVYLPFLNLFFDTEPLGLREWGAILPLILMPSLAAEINKWWLRRQERRWAPAHADLSG